MEETANIICNMAYKMEKNTDAKKPFYINTISSQPEAIEEISEEKACDDETDQSEINNATEKDYVSVIKKVKKENITPDNIGEIMLCQIPGISSITALAIMEKYKTISNLIKELELNNDSMKDLSYTNSKGQVRKINKTCITNIVKFLLKK
jgi:ERCC4-type nuclease